MIDYKQTCASVRVMAVALAFAASTYAAEPALTPADTLRTIALQEVVATGTRNEVDPRILPMTVSVVSETQLTERQETNILPTLTEQVPGLFVTQRGIMGYGVSTGGSGGIKVRGIGGAPNTDILVLIDGLPQYAGIYGHPIADNYQTMLAEHVEVVRGPASMYYGSNAMGGVVNIVTKQPRTDTILTSIHLQGGSFGTVDAGGVNQIRRGRFTSAVGFNYVRTDGHRNNMNFDEYNGFVRLGYRLSDHWRISGTGNIAYFNSSNPGTVDSPLEENDMHVLRWMAALTVDNDYANAAFPTSGAVRLYYNGGKHRIYDGYAAGATPPAATYLHTDLMAGVSAYQSVAFFKGNRTTFGFDYQHFGGHAWNENLSDRSTTDLIHRTQYNIAGYIDFRQNILSWFALDAGVRVDWFSANPAKPQIIPQGGLSFILPHDAQLKAMVSRGFRNPTLRELYMYKSANADLQPESMWNYELSYRQSLLGGRLRLGANIFYLHAQNMIETRMVDGRPLNVNTGELRNAGCEAEMRYAVWQGLHIDANYSYLHMANPVLAAPEHKLNVGLYYHHERFRIGTTVQYIHGLYTALPTATAPVRQESYVMWNAYAAARIWRGLWVNIKADNLLAQEYEINAGFPMPRTTALAGLNWTF